MNVYDFDKTIHRGDSTTHFFFYCLRKQPGLLRFAPSQIMGFLLYFFRFTDKTAAKQRFYRFLTGVTDIDARIAYFWAEHKDHIYAWYPAQQRADDVVISASPEFLLAPICKELGVGTLIASRVEKTSGVYEGKNCHGAEKLHRFRTQFPLEKVEKFYSDSLADAPMAAEAEKAYLVRGGAPCAWPAKRV